MTASRPIAERQRLHARASDAVADLAVTRCSDAAATQAMHAVKLTAITLECFWLPALRDDVDSTLD